LQAKTWCTMAHPSRPNHSTKWGVRG